MCKATKLVNDRTGKMAEMANLIVPPISFFKSYIPTSFFSNDQLAFGEYLSCDLENRVSRFPFHSNMIPHCISQPEFPLCKKII